MENKKSARERERETYRELGGDLSEGISGDTVGDLEVGIVLDGEDVLLAENGGDEGEKGKLGELHFGGFV